MIVDQLSYILHISPHCHHLKHVCRLWAHKQASRASLTFIFALQKRMTFISVAVGFPLDKYDYFGTIFSKGCFNLDFNLYKGFLETEIQNNYN